MREHLEGLFPKVCPVCNRTYDTFRDYLLIAKPEGSAISYDAEVDDWNPANPIGTLTFANCPCGNTLALSSEGMPLLRLWSLLNWARIETKKRNQSPEELINYLRDQITQQVLNDPVKEDRARP